MIEIKIRREPEKKMKRWSNIKRVGRSFHARLRKI